jgi:hypothetical protein
LLDLSDQLGDLVIGCAKKATLPRQIAAIVLPA